MHKTVVNSICCFRDLDTQRYFHTSNEDHQQIEHLKGRLLERADVFCMEYKADWNPKIGQTVGLEDLESYYSQSFHSHAQKQPAKLSADAAHLDFFAYVCEVTDSSQIKTVNQLLTSCA